MMLQIVICIDYCSVYTFHIRVPYLIVIDLSESSFRT